MSSQSKRIAIIGAGWAGCSAALTLAHNGHSVQLFESSRQLGGRARTVEIDNRLLDNGQHLLLGAYTATLKMMRLAGIDIEASLVKLPLQIRYPETSQGFELVAPPLPAPWHMAVATMRAKGLRWSDKLALARFSTTARWMDWQLHNDCTVDELLERYDQTERLSALLWRPLCLAALNTPAERASAQVFLNVLRDSLGANRSASDMLIPRVALSGLFPQKAIDAILTMGGSIHLGSRVTEIQVASEKWILTCANQGKAGPYDAVLLATSPDQAARILPGEPATADKNDLRSCLHRFAYESITTCYLQYDADLRLPFILNALICRPERYEWGQFVFDHGQLSKERAGMLSVVISALDNANGINHSELTRHIAVQLAQAFGQERLNYPLWSKVINEKRATFSCTPNLQRPGNTTPWPNLFLAGDYIASPYPATLESAVQSGINAAELIGRHIEN